MVVCGCWMTVQTNLGSSGVDRSLKGLPNHLLSHRRSSLVVALSVVIVYRRRDPKQSGQTLKPESSVWRVEDGSVFRFCTSKEARGREKDRERGRQQEERVWNRHEVERESRRLGSNHRDKCVAQKHLE